MIGFGKYGKTRNLEIISLSDEKLMLVDPTIEGFYDIVLNYTAADNVQAFIEAIREVQEVGVTPFYRPIMDPSFEGDNIVFRKGNIPAINHSFSFWKQKAKKMFAVEGKEWKLGTEYQYYAFLVHLINLLVAKGWEISAAISAVVHDSKELGNYRNSRNSKNSQDNLEKTGSREACGLYDLSNTFKILACSNEDPGLWLAGARYCDDSYDFPLATLNFKLGVDFEYFCSVGWLVLE